MASVQQASGPASKPGNGKPSDLASAFTDALVSAVRAQESAAAEAHVTAAVTLGWYVAAVAHPGQPRLTAAARGDLGPVAAITDTQVVDLCGTHSKVAFARLAELVSKVSLAAITQAITLLPRERGRDATERRRKVAVAMGE